MNNSDFLGDSNYVNSLVHDLEAYASYIDAVQDFLSTLQTRLQDPFLKEQAESLQFLHRRG